MNAQRWLAAVAAVLVSAGMLAQRVEETVQVTVIEVPVTVAGSDGKAMRGLTKEQFELYDDGKRVPIEYFEVLDLKVLPTGGRVPPAATRNFLLFFDLANSSPISIERAGDAAISFIDDGLEANDLGAVATFTAENGAKLITSFTSDKEMLKEAVRTLGDPQYFKVSDPLMISFRSTGRVRDTMIADTRPGGAFGAGLARDQARADRDALREEEMMHIEQERNTNTQTAQDVESRNRLRVQFSEMSTIARVLDRLHGRKQIILLSEGFDARLVQGREDLGSKKMSEDSDAALSGELWKINSDEKYGNASSARDVSEMTELFRRSDVVLHAIDIKGLRASGADAGAAYETAKGRTNEALFLLTKPTGGTVFQNTNDLDANFARMLEQQEVVYLLGFKAKSTKKADKFHTLKVKTTAPGARVSHRAGYFEPSARMSNLEKTISLTEILMTDRPVNDIGMSVAVTALPGAFVEKARVPVVVELPGGAFLEGVKDALTANLFIYAFDEKNQVKDSLAQRIALDITDDVEQVRGGGIRYFGTLQLPPGQYAIKSIVRVEESGRVGFVRSDVKVPEFESAAVTPPLFLWRTGNPACPDRQDCLSSTWVMLAGPPRGDAYSYPFAIGEEKYVPRSRPALKAGTAHRLALFLHRVPMENLGVTPVLSGAGGTSNANVKLVGRTAADDQGSVKLLFDFTPGALAPGDYELRFTVKPAEGTESVVSLPFRVL